MKIQISEHDLLGALTKVASVVEKRHTLQVLSMIKIVASGDKVELTATDLELTATATVAASIDSEGGVCVPADKLMSAAKSAKKPVTMELDGRILVVKTGRRVFRLQTLPAGEFPSSDIGEFTPIAGEGVLDAMRFVAHAMGNKDARHHLNGLYIAGGDSRTTVVATDGHRLAAQHLGFQSEMSAIIPRKSALIIPTLFDSEADMMSGDNSLSFRSDSLAVTTRLIDWTYPNWERVVPDRPEEVTVSAEDLMTALSAIKATANEKFNQFKMTVGGGEMELKTSNPNNDSSFDVIECDHGGGYSLELGMSIPYAQDALRALAVDTVTLKTDGPSDSVRIDDGNRTCVLMPVRL